MKVRDLMSFLSGVNPEAEVGVLVNTVLHKTEIYGGGGNDEIGVADGLTKEEITKLSKLSCDHVTLEIKEEIII